MTSARRRQLIENLKDKESRDFFVDQYITTTIPFQIRAIRESLGKTQTKLAQEIGTKQPVISQIENPDYGNFTLNTLKKLAAIFDVALIVKFAPFSELVDIFLELSPEEVAVPTYANDKHLHGFPTTIQRAYSPLGEPTLYEPLPENLFIGENSNLYLNHISDNNYQNFRRQTGHGTNI